MADDFDPDTFDLDSFDDRAFQPPEQDGGLAQAEALAAEVRKGAASMVAVAGRVESTLIAFEERATARDKAIMARVVDPEALNRQAALGASQGGKEMAQATADSIANVVTPLRSQIERDSQQREQWMKNATDTINELRKEAWSFGQHWEARRNRWQQLAVALTLGCLLGAGLMFLLNRMATQEAYQRGVADDRAYLLGDPVALREAKAEFERTKAKPD